MTSESSVDDIATRAVRSFHDLLGFWAWGYDLNLVLSEFPDDDTKLAQSCRDWLHVQHWYTVVPDPAMRVALLALMGADDNCGKHIQDTPPRSFCWFFSRIAFLCTATAFAQAGSAVPTVLNPHRFPHLCCIAQRSPLLGRACVDAAPRLALGDLPHNCSLGPMLRAFSVEQSPREVDKKQRRYEQRDSYASASVCSRAIPICKAFSCYAAHHKTTAASSPGST